MLQDRSFVAGDAFSMADITVFAGLMFARPSLISLPFYLAGGLKIVYDLLLYRGFVTHRAEDDGAG